MLTTEERELFLKDKGRECSEDESTYVVADSKKRLKWMEVETQKRVTSWRLDTAEKRLKEEWKLYSHHMRGLVIWTNLSVMWYLSFGFLRNVAYLRQSPQGSSLADLAFEIIDENYHETKRFVEAFFFLVIGLLVAVTLVGNVIYQPPHMQRVFNINIITKAACSYHWGIFLRGLVFVATSVPDARSQCHPVQDESYWERKPQSFLECFSFIDFSQTLCGGDLLFGGNLFGMFFAVHYLSEATRSIFGWYPRTHKMLFWTLYLMVIWECFASVAARTHYLVEVVMSMMFANLYLPYVDSKWVFDVDLDKEISEKDEKRRDHDDEKERKQKTSLSILEYWYNCVYLHAAISALEMFVIWGILAPRGAARWRN